MVAGLAGALRSWAGGPVERKVIASAVTGAVVTAVTWYLATYVYHGPLPAPAARLIPGAAGWLSGAIAGWLAPHTPRKTTS